MLETFFLLFFLTQNFNAQTLVNEYSVDAGLNGWNCWYAWDNHLIACGIGPGGTKRFEIWNIEEITLVGTFPRPSGDIFVVGHKDFYLLGKYYQSTLTKHSILNNSVLQTYTLPYDAIGYDSVVMNDDYIYVRSQYPWGTSIINQKTGALVKFIQEMATAGESRSRWWYSNNALFEFKNLDAVKKTILLKVDSRGTLMWNVTLPVYCGGEETSVGFVAANSRFVYGICIGHPGISQLSFTDGSLIRHFSSSRSFANEMKTTEDYFFAYYMDSSLEQYSAKDADLVATYYRAGDTGHTYPIVRVTKDYIFYNIYNNFQTTVLQWKIYRGLPVTKINYNRGEELNSGSMEIQVLETTPETGINSAIYKNRYSNLNSIIWQNSFFSPIVAPNDKSWSIYYFSGAGNIERATCADIIFYNITTSSLSLDSKALWKYQYSAPDFLINRPSLRDYASFLVVNEDYSFYVIHGGKPCGLQKTFSEMFYITLKDFVSFDITQNLHLP